MPGHHLPARRERQHAERRHHLPARLRRAEQHLPRRHPRSRRRRARRVQRRAGGSLQRSRRRGQRPRRHLRLREPREQGAAEQDALGSSLAYGTADRRRLTADWNHAVESLDGAAFRLNVMGQEGGIAGRDFIERESWGIAPFFALGLGTPTRFYAYSQHIHQDNTPDGAVPTIGVADYVIRDARERTASRATPRAQRELLRPRQRLREHPAEHGHGAHRARFLGEPHAAEHLALRQERAGARAHGAVQAPTHRWPTAPIVRTDPSTWTLDRTRHASFRENTIITNQTNLTAKFATGGIQHSLSTRLRVHLREAVHADHRRPRHARADDPLQPGSHRLLHRGAGHRAQRRVFGRPHRHRRALRVRHAGS